MQELIGRKNLLGTNLNEYLLGMVCFSLDCNYESEQLFDSNLQVIEFQYGNRFPMDLKIEVFVFLHFDFHCIGGKIIGLYIFELGLMLFELILPIMTCEIVLYLGFGLEGIK